MGGSFFIYFFIFYKNLLTNEKNIVYNVVTTKGKQSQKGERKMFENLSRIIVTTQRELDKIPIDFKGKIYLKSKDDRDYLVIKKLYNQSVEVWGTTKAVALKNSSVIARENSSVIASDKSTVEAYDNSKVIAWKNSHVIAFNNSDITSRDDSHVAAYDNSIVQAWENSFVEAYNNSRIIISNPLNLKDYRPKTIVEEQNYNSYKSFLKEKSSEEWNTFTERKKQISRFINIHLNELKSSIKVCEEAKSQLKKAKSLEDLKKFDLI